MTPEQIESLYLAAKRNPDILGIHKVAAGLLGVWAQASRLQARNEKLEHVAQAAYRTTATSCPHQWGCNCIDCLLIQALAELEQP